MVSPPLPTGSAGPPVDTVPPASTSAAVAAAAWHCEALSRAHRLATWVGEGRPVTPKHVLRPRDVPAAARVLSIPAPARINTAAHVPALHRSWKVALAIDFLRIVDGHAVAGATFGQWPDADDGTMRELWLTGLVTAFAAGSRSDDHAGATAFSRIMLGALATNPPRRSSSCGSEHAKRSPSRTRMSPIRSSPFFTTDTVISSRRYPTC